MNGKREAGSGKRQKSGNFFLSFPVLALFTFHVLCFTTIFAEPPSASTASYVYKASSLRDPFVPLLSAAGMLGSTSSGQAAKTERQAQRSAEEIEDNFDPDSLVLKAVLTDKSQGAPIALLANSSNPDDEYVIKGSKIRHVGSGLSLNSFSALIQRDSVIIKKTRGEPLMSVVNFPKQEEGKP